MSDGGRLLGDRVKARRKEFRLSQAQVEVRSRGAVGRSWLSQIERGVVSDPSYRRLAALAQVLELDIEYLVMGTGQIEGEVLRDAVIAEVRSLEPEQLGLARNLLRALRAQSPEPSAHER